MDIPIKNIYYLLSYAWNKLEESEKVKISFSDYDDLLNLLTRVLINGCNVLLKRGLDRSYVQRNEEYIGIKGKIDFQKSLNRNLFQNGKSICYFDQFEYDILQNQILKAIFKKITTLKQVEKTLRNKAWECYYKFSKVKDIELQLNHFSQVIIHKNNSFYDFLLKISRFIYEQLVLSEENGDYLFRDFTRNERAMAYLFESFVRNFYKIEQSKYKVRRDHIRWKVEPLNDGDLSLIPMMKTDIVLESEDRKIVLDTKYYKETLGFNYKEIFHSNNLYQIYAYLRNLEYETNNPINENCEGILLYPTVNKDIDESYMFEKHKIRIVTVNLGQPWTEINKKLLELLNPPL